MTNINFTAKGLAALKPAAVRIDYWDESLPGFGLRITQDGQKTWTVMYRFGGRKRRYTVGTYPTLSLADARNLAREAQRSVRLGIDPAAAKKAEAEMTAKAYKDAKASYVRVKDLADKAATAARSGKVAMQAEVEKQLGALVQRWADLQGRVQAAARTMRAEQKQRWDADAKMVAERLGAAKVAVVSDLSDAKEKLAPIGATLDKWEADLPALTAPTKKPPAKGKS